MTGGRTAIVTGASRGIGAAVASRLATDGLSIVVNYAGDASAADKVVSGIRATGGSAVAFQADVSDAAAVAAMFDHAEAEFGGVDVLVNNAGIMQLATIEEATDEIFDRTIAINLRGVFNGMREGAKRLRSGGHIISFSSSVVGLYRPTYAIYGASKGAIEVLTRVLANELRGRNITVNAIAPGPIMTEMLRDGRPQEVLDGLAAMSPLERLGTTEDISAVVSFLAGSDGQWINGQVLRANGGII